MTSIRIDLAALALRVALGVMLLAHGLTKLLIFTPTGTANYFASLGLPAIIAYLTILFEIGGGLLLLLGVLTSLLALLTLVEVIVISYIHSANGWTFSNAGGGWEYPAFMALTALALMLLGSGRFSIIRLISR